MARERPQPHRGRRPADRLLGVASLHEGDTVVLFYLRADCHRQGIGRALQSAIEQHARAEGRTQLRLLSTRNTRGFYEAMGFVPDGEPVTIQGVLRGYPYRKALAGPVAGAIT